MKNIYLIATGGTIAGRSYNSEDTINYKAGVIKANELLQSVNDLQDIANIQYEDFCQIASENMTTDIWLKLAKRVNELSNQQDIDGIVITHGTDTMEETAFFLNLVCKTQKPIILTGAMLPASAKNPDGPNNIKDAFLVATNEKSVNKNVMIVMNHNIFNAEHIKKCHSTSIDAFSNPINEKLGYIVDKNIFWEKDVPKTNLNFDINSLTELPKVNIITAYADMPDDFIQIILSKKSANIIFDAFGNGTLPEKIVEQLKNTEGFFVNTTQTGKGKAVKSYDNIISGMEYTAKQARILLMLVLTVTKDKNEISNYFK